MTKFEELQVVHERLMEESKAPADPDAFVQEVQRDLQQMRVTAEEISAPRERDQLRAILRFWAAYVYDRTGTYPDTTLHPALQPSSSSSESEGPLPEPSHSRVPLYGIALASGVVLILLLILVTSMVNRTSSPSQNIVATPSDSVNVPVTTLPRPVLPLQIHWSTLTAGPSPFNPNVWAVKLQLEATGGNDSYIFWINGVHLPDISSTQFTVEGQGCVPEKPLVGVTSGGQAASLELVVQSPLAECQQP